MSISQKVLDLSAAIKPLLAVDPSTGVVTAPADLYEKTLPEDLSVDTAKRVYSHTVDFVAATTDAVASVGHAAMSGNKDLKSVELETTVLKDKLSVAVDRVKVSSVSGKEFKTPGGTTIKYTTSAQNGNAGQLKQVREHWKTEYANLAN